MSKVVVAKVPTYRIFLMLIGSKILDLETTYIALKKGYGYEANPITAYFLNMGGFPLMVIASVLIMVGVSLLFVFAQNFFDNVKTTPNFTRFIKTFIYICFAINMIVVINNCIIIYAAIR